MDTYLWTKKKKKKPHWRVQEVKSVLDCPAFAIIFHLITNENHSNNQINSNYKYGRVIFLKAGLRSE